MSPVTDEQHEQAADTIAAHLEEAVNHALDPNVPIGTRIMRAIASIYGVVNAGDDIIKNGGNPLRLGAESLAEAGDKFADRIPANVEEPQPEAGGEDSEEA